MKENNELSVMNSIFPNLENEVNKKPFNFYLGLALIMEVVYQMYWITVIICSNTLIKKPVHFFKFMCYSLKCKMILDSNYIRLF